MRPSMRSNLVTFFECVLDSVGSILVVDTAANCVRDESQLVGVGSASDEKARTVSPIYEELNMERLIGWGEKTH
jgi:hypothetical protein